MAKIDMKKFETHFPVKVGEQVHINHQGCGAGKDTKKRLYLKRVPGGVLGYCHHCSNAGYWFDVDGDDRHVSKLRKWVKDPAEPLNEVFTGRTMSEIEAQPNSDYLSTEAVAWLNKYGLQEGDVFKLNGNPAYYIVGPDDERVGLQYRNFSGDPKYVTEYASDKIGAGNWYINEGSTIFVITEDCFSSKKISMFCSSFVESLSLLGTSLKKVDEKAIVKKQPKNIIIWLDNDLAGRMGAEKISSRLSVICPNSQITIFYENEAKTMTEEQIKKLLSK